MAPLSFAVCGVDRINHGLVMSTSNPPILGLLEHVQQPPRAFDVNAPGLDVRLTGSLDQIGVARVEGPDNFN